MDGAAAEEIREIGALLPTSSLGLACVCCVVVVCGYPVMQRQRVC